MSDKQRHDKDEKEKSQIMNTLEKEGINKDDVQRYLMNIAEVVHYSKDESAHSHIEHVEDIEIAKPKLKGKEVDTESKKSSGGFQTHNPGENKEENNKTIGINFESDDTLSSPQPNDGQKVSLVYNPQGFIDDRVQKSDINENTIRKSVHFVHNQKQDDQSDE